MTIATAFSTRAHKAVNAAIRIAKQGLGNHYQPSLLADVWRRAAPAHWSRLALLGGLSPEDAQDPAFRVEVVHLLSTLNSHGGST